MIFNKALMNSVFRASEVVISRRSRSVGLPSTVLKTWAWRDIAFLPLDAMVLWDNPYLWLCIGYKIHRSSHTKLVSRQPWAFQHICVIKQFLWCPSFARLVLGMPKAKWDQQPKKNEQKCCQRTPQVCFFFPPSTIFLLMFPQFPPPIDLYFTTYSPLRRRSDVAQHDATQGVFMIIIIAPSSNTSPYNHQRAVKTRWLVLFLLQRQHWSSYPFQRPRRVPQPLTSR